MTEATSSTSCASSTGSDKRRTIVGAEYSVVWVDQGKRGRGWSAVDKPAKAPATYPLTCCNAFSAPSPSTDDADATVIELDHQIRRTTTCHGLINEYRVAA